MLQRSQLTVAAVFTLMTASSALAGTQPPPIDVPEPGSLSMMAVGMAAIAVAYRWRKKK